MKKTSIIIAAIMLAAITAVSFAACGDKTSENMDIGVYEMSKDNNFSITVKDNNEFTMILFDDNDFVSGTYTLYREKLTLIYETKDSGGKTMTKEIKGTFYTGIITLELFANEKIVFNIKKD